MQKVFLTFLTLLFLVNAFGQKTEVRMTLSSGLFSFTGQSAEATSVINYSDYTKSGYTNNPYGSEDGLCYGLSGNFKRVSKRNFIAGLDLGYEKVRSKISINGISDYTGTSTYESNATGQTFLNYSFINLTPFMGYRFPLHTISLELTAGIDIAYCLKAREDGKATATNGTEYETSVDRKTIKIDIRPSIQISTNYKKFGLFAGYSFGLVNYKSGYIGGINECYARLFRFGITYVLK